jgi:NTE family protein
VHAKAADRVTGYVRGAINAEKTHPAPPKNERHRYIRAVIDLALQGGGSRGAFTWGVLDRLLEEERLQIVAISGTSAGAMNAALLADGWK